MMSFVHFQELFVVYLAKETLKKGKSKQVDYSDLYEVIHSNSVLDFLYGKSEVLSANHSTFD